MMKLTVKGKGQAIAVRGGITVYMENESGDLLELTEGLMALDLRIATSEANHVVLKVRVDEIDLDVDALLKLQAEMEARDAGRS